MAARDHQSEVIDLLTAQQGLPRDKFGPSSRLLQDLGMDGDDAVDFFNSVQERFGTDLGQLHEHWGDHFGPEGFSVRNGLVIVPAIAVGTVVTIMTGLSVVWGVIIIAATLAAWLFVMQRWGPPDRLVPITVDEVVAAVKAGSWSDHPDG